MKSTVLPEDRVRALVLERNRKMAESAHAYVRGSTKRFYEWLSQAEHAEIPSGPAIWICGDCHSGNLGPVANGDGALAIQIRDLDQAVIGNPAHDLIRLALSLAMAARSSDLPGVTTALMLERMIEGYSKAFLTNVDDVSSVMPGTVKALMRQAAKRSWKHLADESIEGEVRQLPIGPRFWPLTRFERESVDAMFAEQRLEDLVSALPGMGTGGKVRVVDAAFWRKGCSSLGRLRVAALLVIGKGKNEVYRLMDIKEAVAPSAPRFPDVVMPIDNGERVVEGARHLSPYLGSRMVATDVLGKSVFVRELLPQDLKIEIDKLTREEALTVAEYLAHTVGLAHARQMDSDDRKSWLAVLKIGPIRKLEAPSWLWASVVDLVATHEAAYLEHCRRYALVEPA
jgi:uncharacterized protein (DUF2252 family)